MLRADGDSNDHIVFAPGLAGTLFLSSALPAITSSMTITAPGITIDGAGAFRIFNISGSNLDVTFKSMALLHGRAADGGALYIDDPGGQVTLSSSTVSSNVAFGTGTAGYVSQPPYTPARGGGIFDKNADLKLQSSTVSGNSANGVFHPGDYGAGLGGGLYVGTAAQLTVLKSTITANVAKGSTGIGGGIFSLGTVQLGPASSTSLGLDSTISKNTATSVAPSALTVIQAGPAQGGGIYIGPAGSFTATSATISGNSAHGASGSNGATGIDGTGGSDALGGGVSNHGSLALQYSIVSGNTAHGRRGGKGANGAAGAAGGVYGLDGQAGWNGGAGGKALGGHLRPRCRDIDDLSLDYNRKYCARRRRRDRWKRSGWNRRELSRRRWRKRWRGWK